MISFANVRSLARAEMRTIRRLFRFWLFSAAAMLLGLLFFGQYLVMHGLGSGFSASAGAFSPKFLLSQTALWQTTVLGIGVVFLAFDLRARDRRDRVIEVLDSRPYSNVELVLGRFLGALFMVWGVAFLAMIIIQGFGHSGVAFGWWVGEPAIWSSVWAYLLIEALPALAVYVAFVHVVALVGNNRLIAAVAGLGLAVGSTFLSFRLPLYILPSLALNGGYVSSISEVAPQIWTVPNLLNRGSFALLAAGLLAVAVAVHPRLDNTNRKRWGIGGGAGLAAGAALIFATITWNVNQLAGRDAWRAAHEERQADPVVDLQTIRGSVDIERGGRLALDLEVQFLSAADATATFSLNPGLEVDGIWNAGGAALTFAHDNGLLDIDLGATPPAGQVTGVRVRASGRPDLRFAYLDAVIDFNTIDWQDAQIFILGNLNGFVERNYVALPASLAWLPRPGASVGTGDPRQRPRDFFELDLTVRTPSAWTVAGPGKAESTGDGERFAPAASVPEVMLVAGRFDRRTTVVEGTEVELLFHPAHLKNLDYFGDAREEIEAVAAERFAAARELGLPYPYRQFTLVEVPWTLRSYGAGWRMDTERAPPGMLLISESGLPTSRFEFRFRNPERYEDQEGGLARAKAQGLREFFRADFSGGNAEAGGARNLFLYRTGARGPEALALEALCHNLVNRLVNGGESYFSAHLFDREFSWTLMNALQGGLSGQFASGSGSMSSGIVNGITDRPGRLGCRAREFPHRNRWGGRSEARRERALSEDVRPRRRDSRRRRSRTGRRDAGHPAPRAPGRHFFRGRPLPSRRRGGCRPAGTRRRFSPPDRSAGLPRVPGPKSNGCRTTTRACPSTRRACSSRNGEEAPGLFRPALRCADPGRLSLGLERTRADPRPYERRVRSRHLPAARDDARVSLSVAEPARVPRRAATARRRDDHGQRTALRGVRPADWLPAFLDNGANTIVVDDLDPGFSVAADEAESGGIRLQGGLAGIFAPTIETDQGLPVFQIFTGAPSAWSRYEQSSSWGRYRRTTAVVSKGDGSRRATYRAELPETGRWRVELHVPSLSPVPGGGQVRREVRVGGGDGDPSSDNARARPGPGLVRSEPGQL